MKIEYVDYIGETPLQKTTTIIAGASAMSYWWLDYVSNLAASWLPILGCLWLIIQGASLVYRTWYKKDSK